jgi:hypothetical protein
VRYCGATEPETGGCAGVVAAGSVAAGLVAAGAGDGVSAGFWPGLQRISTVH